MLAFARGIDLAIEIIRPRVSSATATGVGTGGVHDDDALAGGGVGVDVIHTHTGPADDAEPGGVREQLGVGLDGGADDEGVGVSELGGEAVLDLLGGDDVPARLLLEDGKGCRGDFFGEYDLHDAEDTPASIDTDLEFDCL